MMHLMVAGNVGRDSEIRTTQSGKSNASWSVACDTGFGDKKKTTWVRCTMWGERGEKLSAWIKKGTKIVVTGEPTINEYVAKDGTTKTSLELRVSEVKLMGGSEHNDSGEETAIASNTDLDIPF